jgi:hypothetical protein
MSEDQHGGGGKDLVRVHIDREPFEVGSPTTGDKLYEIAGLGPDKELFRTVSGNEEDELVPRDRAPITLVEDEHFYSQKDFRLIVNLEEKFVANRTQDFDQIVKLAFPVPPPGTEISYKVLYRKGPPVNPKGRLLEGQEVRVKDGMVFDVTYSDRS